MNVHTMRGPRWAMIHLPVLVLAAACGGSGDRAGDVDGLPDGVSVVVAEVGFSTPESVAHDPGADVYLVSNINGGPAAPDGNGFISRISPDGAVLDLKWIDGESEEINLDAPKGMVVLEGRLFVADIDCVRVFRLEDRVQEDDICFPESTFLNGLAVDQNGTLYVTDSGMTAGPDGLTPTGTDAVYRFTPDGRRQNMAMSTSLGIPNGIVVSSRGIMVVTFGTGEIYRLAADAKRTPVLAPSNRQFDGVIFTSDGSMAFSDWATSAVYMVTVAGITHTILEGADAPADIGYDATRNRIMVPLFNMNQVWFVDLD